MENARQIIKKHNNYASRKKPRSTPLFNCPMNGNCIINNIIYKLCTVSPKITTKQRANLGLTEGVWKQRY